jgi:NADH:ubiquinone oxidoreductase subunit F (NADH-binding)
VARAQEIGPAATIEMIERAGLRGRGGGGFPTGRKWSAVAYQDASRRYLVCNGAEGEPGTFKDRTLMRLNPYQLVEGVVIAAFAIGAQEAFIAMKSQFTQELEAVTRAVQEMQQVGICSDCTVNIIGGPDEYLLGEEKALLEVIEGGDPLPRLLPPFEHGLFATAPQTGWEGRGTHRSQGAESNPTVVNNVETLSNVPHILARGDEWFRSLGTDESPGTQVCTVVGDVVAQGVDEVELGTPLRDVLDRVGGGARDGRSIKAVLSGVANPVVDAANLDVPLSYEGFQAIGSGMGAAGFIVFDDSACMVEVARMCSRFLWVESCGQCPACKRGSAEITARLERIEGGNGTDEDIAEIASWIDKVTDGNRCYLAVEEQVLVASIVRTFGAEFEEHMQLGRCPRPRDLRFPKLVDIADGHVVYDTRVPLKQPDWTYAEEPHLTT